MKNIIGLLVFSLCAFVMSRAMDWITDPQLQKQVIAALKEELD